MRSGTAKQVVVYTVTLLLLSSFTGCAVKKPQPVSVLRMGYFANITHAQALIGVARGDFAKALGHIKLETMVFNAGPSVVEAMFANQLDCSFIGPSPAINGFIKSSGKAFKIVSGASAR
jgi:NitT/TauT family transport system substrate-binding protein